MLNLLRIKHNNISRRSLTFAQIYNITLLYLTPLHLFETLVSSVYFCSSFIDFLVCIHFSSTDQYLFDYKSENNQRELTSVHDNTVRRIVRDDSTNYYSWNQSQSWRIDKCMEMIYELKNKTKEHTGLITSCQV